MNNDGNKQTKKWRHQTKANPFPFSKSNVNIDDRIRLLCADFCFFPSSSFTIDDWRQII